MDRKTLHATVLKEESQRTLQAVQTEGPEQLQMSLVHVSFVADAHAQYSAALELAKAKQYTAAKNYINFALMHNPPDAEVAELCKQAVNTTRSAAKGTEAGGFTWGDFPHSWRNNLQVAYRLLVAKPQLPTEELVVWVRMLLSSGELFGGPASHLTLAFVYIVATQLIDSKRFEPPARVLVQTQPGNWVAGVLLPLEDKGKASRAAKGTTPSTRRPAKQDTEEGTSAQASKPELHERLFSAKTATRAVQVSQTTTSARKADSEPLIRVRLLATPDLPQRTTFMKRQDLLRDVGRGTAKPYLPGLLLLEAAALGNEPVVSALLNAGVSIYEADEDASTVIHHAAYNCDSPGHRAVCQLLLDYGADPEAFNSRVLCAWDCALVRRDTELRRIFQKSESDKDFTEKAKSSGDLHKAIDARDDQLALTLVNKLMPPIVNEVTAMMMAARRGSLAIVQACLNAGWNVEQRTTHGCTAVLIAAEQGHAHILKAMLACSVPSYRLLVADNEQYTPLMRASENGHIDAVELLLEKSSLEQINCVNQDGWTALMLAAYNGFEEVVEELLDAGARADIGKPVGTKNEVLTPLCYASWTGHVECVRELISSDVSLSDQRGKSALQLAVKHGNAVCEAILRETGRKVASDLASDDASSANMLETAAKMLDAAEVTHAQITKADAAQHAMAKAPAEEVAQSRMALKEKQTARARRRVSKRTAGRTSALGASTGANDVGGGDAHVSGELLADLAAQESTANHAADLRETFDETLEKQLVKQQDDLVRELAELRVQLKTMRAAKAAAKVNFSKQPWAFSPSGKWLPGLWAGLWDRDAPVELPDSVSFINTNKASGQKRLTERQTL